MVWLSRLWSYLIIILIFKYGYWDLNIKVKFLIVESSNHTQLRSLGTGSELPMEDLMVLIAELIKAGTRNNPLVEIISALLLLPRLMASHIYLNMGMMHLKLIII